MSNTHQFNNSGPEAEDNHIAIIPIMVSLSGIMFEASHLLYHSANRSLAEMSHIAMTMDQKILAWKENLPEFLDLDAPALNDPDWAFKQKFVLKQRTYSTGHTYPGYRANGVYQAFSTREF